MDTAWPPASVEAIEEISEGISVLTYKPLNVDEILRSVGDDRAGATAAFIGTTRNSFKGGCDAESMISTFVLNIEPLRQDRHALGLPSLQ